MFSNDEFEAELGVLGNFISCGFLSPRLGVLDPEDFADPIHRRLFLAAMEIIGARGGPAEVNDAEGALTDYIWRSVPWRLSPAAAEDVVDRITRAVNQSVIDPDAKASLRVIRGARMRNHLISVGTDLIEKARRHDFDGADGLLRSLFSQDIKLPRRVAMSAPEFSVIKRVKLVKRTATLAFAEVCLAGVNLSGIRVERLSNGKLRIEPPNYSSRGRGLRPAFALQPHWREAIEREVARVWALQP